MGGMGLMGALGGAMEVIEPGVFGFIFWSNWVELTRTQFCLAGAVLANFFVTAWAIG